MNRKSAIILGVIFLLTSVSVFGQEVTFKLGEDNKWQSSKFLKENSDGSVIVLQTSEKEDKFLVRFSGEKYIPEHSTKIEFKLDKNSSKKGNALKYEDVCITDNTIYVLASGYNRDTKFSELYISLYDVNFDLKKAWTLIDSVKPYYFAEFEIMMSEDKTKFLVMSYGEPKRSDTSITCSYVVFNSELDIQFKNEITFDYSSLYPYAKFIKEKVGNNGEIYFTLISTSGNTVLYQISKNDKKAYFKNLKQYGISLPDNNVVDALFEFNKKGDLILTGLYSAKGDTKGEDKGLLGAYYIQIDGASMQEKTVKTIPFSEDFLSKFISNRKITKGKGLPNTYRLKSLVISETGGTTLIAEEVYSTLAGTGTKTSANGYSNSVQHNDDIVLIGLNESGNFKYLTTIDKDDRNATSYTVLSVSNGLFLFYNDFYKDGEVGKSKLQKFAGRDNNVLVKAFVDNAGNVTKDVVITNKDSKVEFEPKKSIKTSNSKGLLMFGTSRKKLKIIRIDVK